MKLQWALFLLCEMQVVVQMQVTMEGKGEEERQEEDEEGSSYMFQNWRSCYVLFLLDM
jgi:hypothetical protein